MTIANNIHHTSLKAIQNRMEELNNQTFNICREEIIKEIGELINKTASHITDIPIRIT